MFWLTLYVLGCSALIQILLQYPRKCLGWCLPLVRKISPTLAGYFDEKVVRSASACAPASETVFASRPRVPTPITPCPSSNGPITPCPPSKNLITPCSPAPCNDFCDDMCPPGPCSPCSPSPYSIPSNVLDSFMCGSKSKGMSFDSQLEQYEEKHATKVIFINHKENKSIFGTSYESLGERDAQAFVDIMRTIDPNTHITLVLKTRGGSMTSAEIIVHALLLHPGKVSVYIPYVCMSAGTIIALTADEIHMDPNAYCGPIDPQFFGISVTDVIKFCQRYSDSNTWVGDLAKLISGQAESAMERIRSVLRQDKSRSETTLATIDAELISGKYNHDKPLFPQDMQEITPNVIASIPTDLMELYQAFINRKDSNGSPISQMLGNFGL